MDLGAMAMMCGFGILALILAVLAGILVFQASKDAWEETKKISRKIESLYRRLRP